MVIEEIMNGIAENIVFLIVLFILLILVIVIANTIKRIYDNKNQVKLGELEIQKDKLNMLRKQSLIEQMKESATVLTDNERFHLDSIREDISILSRKNLALMNETESRLERLERGVERGTMQGHLQEIKDNEKKIFGIKEEK